MDDNNTQGKKYISITALLGKKIVREVNTSGANDNFPKHSHSMILRPKEKMGQLTRQSPEVPCNLKYSVTR